MSNRHPEAAPGLRWPGFSLVELLIVLAVLAVLLAMLLPALSSFRTSGGKVQEMSAARQLLLAYRTYAVEYRGAVMPGYRSGLRARDDRGQQLADPMAARYPWRLAPYLDVAIDALFIGRHRETLRKLEQTDHAAYVYGVSLSPSLGLNATWLGGNEDELAFDRRLEEVYGRFYVIALAEVLRPARLMVFTSARGVDPLAEGLGLVEGYFATRSPRLTVSEGGRWSEIFDRNDLPSRFGFVSPRYDGLAVAAFVDGHVDVLGETSLRDMRHWANRATRPDWTLAPRE